MSEDQNGQNGEIQAEGQQQSAMPTENKPAEVISPEAQATGQLPEEVSERTKLEFAKLKEANRLLAEQVRQKPEARQSVFDQFRPVSQPQYAPQQQVAPVTEAQTMVDENGYLDSALLETKIARLEQQAKEAQEQARRAQEEIANYQLTNEQKAVFAKYPELDPSSDKFDEQMTKRVTNEVFGQIATVGRENYLYAADSVFALFKPQANPSQAVEEYKQAVKAKEQINATPGNSGVSQANQSVSPELEKLREATRRGDPKALDARLKALGM